MSDKRLRMFAGPNGSGKSTIFNQIKDKVDFGVYLNADDIERILKNNKSISLFDFVENDITNRTLQEYIHSHSLFVKAEESGFPIKLYIIRSIVYTKNVVPNSYETSLLVDFIRSILLYEGKKLTFETVMSHESKIEILKKSKDLGYKNYLYYICTDDVELNISRVKERVLDGGHDVPKEKIKKRYFNSLELLHKTVKHTYRTYIFDNSGENSILILEIFNGEVIIHSDAIPNWVDRWLLSYFN